MLDACTGPFSLRRRRRRRVRIVLMHLFSLVIKISLFVRRRTRRTATSTESTGSAAETFIACIALTQRGASRRSFAHCSPTSDCNKNCFCCAKKLTKVPGLSLSLSVPRLSLSLSPRKKMQAQSALSPSWAALERHYHAIKEQHMRTMFERDPSRFQNFRCVFYLTGCTPMFVILHD
jgi:hypothetical protein